MKTLTKLLDCKRPNHELPGRAGVGFKAEHAHDILGAAPTVGWFEIHPENYMVAGGARLAMLEELSARYPVSMHGVGLSIRLVVESP